MKYRKIVVTDNNGVETVFADVNATYEHEYIKIEIDGGFKIIPLVSIKHIVEETSPFKYRSAIVKRNK